MNRIILLIVVLGLCESACTDEPSCFVKSFLQFNFPGEGIYKLSKFTYPAITDMEIKGYGDFNNDLVSDIAVLKDSNAISVLVWDEERSLYNQTKVLTPTNCLISNLYLYDINDDGFLDITGWGQTPNTTQSCMIPFIQFNNTFIPGSEYKMTKTTDPIIFSFSTNDGGKKFTGLLLYRNNKRQIAVYDDFKQTYTLYPWTDIFNQKSYESIPFSNPHWNSFVDVTGDCRSDIIITDDDNNVEFWINNGSKFIYSYSEQFQNLTSLSFADMNYNGAIDMIVTFSQTIYVYFNEKSLSENDEFCCSECKNITFSKSNISYIIDPHGSTIPEGILHVNDINIDGYPDILMVIKNTNNQTVPIIYQNNEGNSFSQFSIYNSIISNQNYSGNVVSASFVDILENGILDILIVVDDTSSTTKSYAFYNNYLFQNYFFIKGFGAQSFTEDGYKGTQLTGVSFYWVNSVGDYKRVAYLPQIIQTGYSALQLPYGYCGLGRANNYVQGFTLGFLGQSKSWTPIIPNSQLAVYAKTGDTSNWKIRIFVLPTQSLIYVVIVSSVILGVWGIALIIMKYRAYRKREQINEQFIH